MSVLLGGADLIVGPVRLAGHALRLAEGRIAAIEPDDPQDPARVALPAGSVLAPGFIDIQVNGGGGFQFNETPTAEAARAIAAAHRRLGTVGILPTLITDTPETTARAVAAIEATRGDGILGLHLEGPHLSPRRPGVHRPDRIRPPDEADLAFLAGLPARLGRPVIVTLAPETMPEAALERLAGAGLILCAGHTEAPPDRLARIAGFTHLFNAMPPIAARAPGPAAAALLRDDAYAGLIADGIHVDPATIRLLLRCKPAERILLVSDAMAPAGTDLPEFRLQGRRILRQAGRLATEDGTLAGADLSLASAVRVMAGLGVPLPQAVAMASTNPASFLGLAHERGRLAPGLRADLTLLGPDLAVLATWRDGARAPA